MANRIIIDNTARGAQVTAGNFVVTTIDGVRVAAFAYKEDAEQFANGGHCYKISEDMPTPGMMERRMKFSDSTKVAAEYGCPHTATEKQCEACKALPVRAYTGGAVG